MSNSEDLFEVDYSEQLMENYNSLLRKKLDDSPKIVEKEKILGVKSKKTPENFNWKNEKYSGGIVCFDYALGLCNSKSYLNLVKNSPVSVDSFFIRYLLENKYIKEEVNPSLGNMVLYFKRSCGLYLESDFRVIYPSLPCLWPPKGLSVSNFVVLIKKDSCNYKAYFIKGWKLYKDNDGVPVEIPVEVYNFIEPYNPFFKPYTNNESNHDTAEKIIREVISKGKIKLDRHPTHAGILIDLKGKKVRSKFGMAPAIFEHELWKVPMSYGSERPSYYSLPSVVEIEEIFKEYRGILNKQGVLELCGLKR